MSTTTKRLPVLWRTSSSGNSCRREGGKNKGKLSGSKSWRCGWVVRLVAGSVGVFGRGVFVVTCLWEWDWWGQVAMTNGEANEEAIEQLNDWFKDEEEEANETSNPDEVLLFSIAPTSTTSKCRLKVKFKLLVVVCLMPFSAERLAKKA